MSARLVASVSAVAAAVEHRSHPPDAPPTASKPQQRDDSRGEPEQRTACRSRRASADRAAQTRCPVRRPVLRDSVSCSDFSGLPAGVRPIAMHRRRRRQRFPLQSSAAASASRAGRGYRPCRTTSARRSSGTRDCRHRRQCRARRLCRATRFARASASRARRVRRSLPGAMRSAYGVVDRLPRHRRAHNCIGASPWTSAVRHGMAARPRSSAVPP